MRMTFGPDDERPYQPARAELVSRSEVGAVGNGVDAQPGDAATDAPRFVGPVRMPGPAEVDAAVAASPALARVRELAARCAAPGLPLTDTGNLRPSAARTLAADLGSGDGATWSAELDLVVRTACEARAVRRHQGRLVSVARFAARSDRDAYTEVVRAAVDATTTVLVAELLDAGDAGLPTDDLVATAVQVATGTELIAAILPPADLELLARTRVDRLAGLGLTHPGDPVTLTAAGVAVGAELVSDELGVDVLVRADPATATAAELVESVLMMPAESATADLVAWSRHGRDVADLLAALIVEDRPSGAVLGLLRVLQEMSPEATAAAAAAHRDGPHGAVVTMWLMAAGAVDPGTVPRRVVLDGTVAVTAGMLDEEGPDAVVEFVSTGTREEALLLVDELWRAGHERTGDVLDALGHHHPDEQVAKAARRSRMKLRGR